MSENKIPAGAKDGAETIGPEDLEKFKNRFREEMESFLSGYEDKNKPRILVAGSTGCGKSTLCNLVFKRKVCTEGAGTPVTRGVRKITRPEIPVIVYDSEGYETGARFSDRSDGEESAGQKYCDLIMNAVEKERIDLVWYCISAPGSRVTDVDISLIKQFRSLKKPVAVVLTQIDVATEEDCEELKKTIAGEVDGPNPEEGRKIAIFESTNDSGITVPEGLDELYAWSLVHLEESRRDAFVISCHRGFDEKYRIARKWVSAAATAAAGTAFSPVPFSDAAVITPIQLALFAKTLALWNMADFEKILGTGIAEVTMPLIGKSLAGNLIKLIPGAGSVIGGIINAGVAGSLTYGTGMALNKSCRILNEKHLEGSVTADTIREIFSSETLRACAEKYVQERRDSGSAISGEQQSS